MESPRTSSPSPASGLTSALPFLDQLLADQQELHTPPRTPIVAISEKVDAGEIRTNTYRHLIPLSKPKQGEQYAFQVELDKCTSCKACVAACHSLNGLEDNEAWRDVGLLLGGKDAPGWQQTVTSACHHCLEPECMHGCPVKAYEKNEETGIVRHLDDQCIGCQYCMLKCPFDVPKYSSRLGIVRKCDMCHQRLAVGESPACVQACPSGAIKIITVDQAELRREREAERGFLTGAPSPAITLPTTQFIGREVPASAKPADQDRLVTADPHLPLVFMLTLTQAGVGALLVPFLLSAEADASAAVIAGLLLFFTGLSCAVLHLGRPLGAWRFFLGLKTSWLSREILSFSLYAPVALSAGLAFLVSRWGSEGNALPAFVDAVAKHGFTVAAILGLIAVFTSVMIYHDTKRANWHWTSTAPAFFGTTIAFAGLFLGASHPAWVLLLAVPLIVDAMNLLPLRSAESAWSPAHHRARLLWHPLRKWTVARFVCGALALCLAFVSLSLGGLFLLAGELLSRALYFRGVHSPKMTGSF